MRLKTFTAPTLADAMELVRRDMGEDAIIVSTQQGSDALTCRVTAAIEDTLEAEESIPTEPEAMLSDDALEDYLRARAARAYDQRHRARGPESRRT